MNIKILKLLSISFVLSILNGYIFLLLNNYFFHLKNKKLQSLSSGDLHFLTLLLAPVIETIIYQYFLYLILNNILKLKNEILIIIIMAAAFGLSHTYHWLYMCTTFIGGLILNNFYIQIIKMKNMRYAVLLTMLLHFLYNLYGNLFIG